MCAGPRVEKNARPWNFAPFHRFVSTSLVAACAELWWIFDSWPKSVKAESETSRRPPFVVKKNFHLIPSSNGWKVFLWAGGMGESPRIVLCMELSNFHCRNWMGNDWIIVRYFGSSRRRREGREIVGDMKSEEKLFRLNSIREIIFLLGSRWSSLDVDLLFFASHPPASICPPLSIANLQLI